MGNRVICVVNVEGHFQPLRWSIDVVRRMQEELQLACLDNGTPRFMAKDWKAEEITVEAATGVDVSHVDRKVGESSSANVVHARGYDEILL